MSVTGSDDSSRPPVVVVTGPTSAGKTRLAIALASRFDGEILNADSMQVYRGMDIGPAKPTPVQRAQAPHHLIDLVQPDAGYSAGCYIRDARAAAERVHGRGRLVLGTLLFIAGFTVVVMAIVAIGILTASMIADLVDEIMANPEKELQLGGERIEAVERTEGLGDPSKLPIVAPGLIDLQVNGGNGAAYDADAGARALATGRVYVFHLVRPHVNVRMTKE